MNRLQRLWYTHWPSATRELVLPDFLGIGAQKSGTSWLYQNLRVHPELFLPQPKELHFFDTFSESLPAYCDYFKPSGGKVKGEITPAYAILSPRRIRFVRAIMPDVRLVMLLRDPVDRAWSQLCMKLRSRNAESPDQLTEQQILQQMQAKGKVARSDYASNLQNWLRYFDREQLYIGFYPDIAERPQQLLSDIFRHLRVSADVIWDDFPIHRVFAPRTHGTMLGGKPNPFPCPPKVREHLAKVFEPQLEIIRDRFGLDIERFQTSTFRHREAA